MKNTEKSKSGQIVNLSKSLVVNQLQARARAKINIALGLVSPLEAGVTAPRWSSSLARMARDWSTSPAWRAADVRRGGLAESLRMADTAAGRDAIEAARVEAAGLLSRSDWLMVTAPPRVAAGVMAAHVEAARAAAAGLLSRADIVAAHVEAARVAAARVAAAGLLSASEADEAARVAVNSAAVARLRRFAAMGGAGVTVDTKAGALVVAESIGAAAIKGGGMAALGRGDSAARAALARAAAAAGRGIGQGWHDEQAKQAQVVYRGLLADETRARAAELLRSGLLGRASARAVRIGTSSGRRWLRGNSRREALALAEVGGAAGVDDLQAGRDWQGELQSISVCMHLRAAGCGVALLDAAALLRADPEQVPFCPGGAMAAPCAALLAPIVAVAAMTAAAARLAILGRGRRIDCKPVIEWTSAGRQVTADSIGIIARGRAWAWASRHAGRAMHSARYGRGGRDGKEVAADWSISGNMRAASAWEVEAASGAAGPALADSPWRCEPTRRPSVVQSARDSLAADCIALRSDLRAARAAADGQTTVAARIAAGAVLGGLKRSLGHAVEWARALGALMRGQSADCSAWLVTAPSGRVVLTAAGKKMAERLRSAQSMAERASGAAQVARVAGSVSAIVAGVDVGALAGDDIAASDTVAPSSLLQSGECGAGLAAALAARAVVEPLPLTSAAGAHLRAAMLTELAP